MWLNRWIRVSDPVLEHVTESEEEQTQVFLAEIRQLEARLRELIIETADRGEARRDES